MLQTDDDTLCRATLAPYAGLAGPARASGALDMHFLSADVCIEKDVIFPNLDLLALHESALESGPPAVRVTQTGLIGDSGMGFPGVMLFLGDRQRARLVGSSRVYQLAQRGKQVVQSYASTGVRHSSICMSTHFAIDNHDPLPPFVPVHRNSDGVFGWLFEACVPGATIGYLPLLIWHARHGTRSYLRPTPQQAGRSRCGDMIMALLSLLPRVSAVGSADGLMRVGAEFSRLASTSREEFQALLLVEHRRFVEAQAARLESTLDAAADLPPFWRRDAIGYLSELKKSNTFNKLMICVDMPWRSRAGSHLEAFQQLCRDFAALLSWWPALFAAATALKT